MTVRELLDLVPVLELADPDEVIQIDAGSSSILILDTRPGLHQAIDDRQGGILTQGDAEFLRALRVLA